MDIMTNEKKVFAMLLVVSTLLGSVGQLLFKIALLNSNIILFLFYLLIGLFFYSVATIIYFYILGRTHLSWVYGFGGLSYLFTSILAVLILNEPLTQMRLIGIVIIASGTALIGLS